ncbi:MAG: hypothetical protein INR71_09935, partial [Terriglobus roseus]|nr:hypothetical protein [Terriglobus roseus]
MAASKPPADEQHLARADTSGGPSDATAAAAALNQSAPTPAASRASAFIPSPQPSRTVSPVRRQPRPQAAADSKIPTAQPPSATASDGQRIGARAPSQSDAPTDTAGAGMHWPVSPRLKSPPPSTARRPSAPASKAAANGTVNGAGGDTTSPTKSVAATHDVSAQPLNGDSARSTGNTVVAAK